MRKIILASKSPRRKKLLSQLGLEFEVHASNYEEGEGTALQHAKGKALDVAKHYKNAIVIGVDTVGEYKGRIIGKPKDKNEAKEILGFLNGSKHKVVTGIFVIDTATGKTAKGISETFVKFCKMTEKEMDAYINSGEGKDKAAGYAIQGFGALFVERIEGDYFNVVGLPIFLLSKLLKKIEINLVEICKKIDK
jgi:septum formation protein